LTIFGVVVSLLHTGYFLKGAQKCKRKSYFR
jgi:hypothetical protein